MALEIIEHKTLPALGELIERINGHPGESWGVAVVRRDYMRVMTNEAFMLVVKPILQGAEEPHVFFTGNKYIYIVWRGRQRFVYFNLRSFVSTLPLPQAERARLQALTPAHYLGLAAVLARRFADDTG